MHHTQPRRVNFGAGPAALNEQVLREFKGDLMNFSNCGVGVGELSHRSDLFEEGILGEANGRLARLCGLDLKEWAVLWMAGGGTGQFAAIPLNFAFTEGKKAVYLVTGVWSEKAAEEAKKLLGAEKILVLDLRVEDLDEGGFLRKGLKGELAWMSEFKKLTHNETLNYIYYCDNETVDGIELPEVEYFQSRIDVEGQEGGVVFVVDASSNFLSRELPRRATGVIFAGVQKNLGAAGVTVVLLKKDLLYSNKNKNENKKIDPHSCPSVLDYGLAVKNNSMLNTPPVMAIHLCNLVLKDLEERFRGGLRELNEFSVAKSEELYKAIEGGKGDFYCPVMKEFRSRMNVIFKSSNGHEAAEEAFLKRTEAAGMIQLKGHRSMGGLRASLYNAVTLEQVRHLISILNQRRRVVGLSTIKRLSFSSKAKGNVTDDNQNNQIVGPGTRTGTIGSEYDQAVGVERLEMLSKLAGKSLFSSSQLLCHPKGENVKGTLSDPVLVETLASEEDAMEVKERIVGCSGVPKGSHEIGFFWVRGGVERCPECGQAFKLKSLL